MRLRHELEPDSYDPVAWNNKLPVKTLFKELLAGATRSLSLPILIRCGSGAFLRKATWALIVVVVSAWAWSGVAPLPAGYPASFQSSATANNARVQTVQFQSQLVGKSLPYNVVLPAGYDLPATRDRRYPVVYLLHGLFGHYDNWTTRTRLADYTATSEVIIVTPEGNNGWYTDSQLAPKEQYESYIVKELIPDVDRRFRTISDRSGRAIAGLSMGGYGAIKFGVKYPAMFAFAGSMSGAMNAASWTREELAGLPSIWNSLQQVFGDEASQARLSNDLPKRIRDLSHQESAALPFIYLDCGTEDPLFPSNRSFAELLLSRKIPHEYRQRPGGHSWAYWDAQVQEVLKLALKKMQK